MLPSRRQSPRKLFRLPLWAIALGQDWERGEMRGHARGIFAFGDIATGWFACGGLARGLLAIGGLAVGLFAIGGGAIGGLIAVGGGAVGGIALGGAAIGGIAVGGGAFGYYAFGGEAVGVHTISALHQDPAALEFFRIGISPGSRRFFANDHSPASLQCVEASRRPANPCRTAGNMNAKETVDGLRKSPSFLAFLLMVLHQWKPWLRQRYLHYGSWLNSLSMA